MINDDQVNLFHSLAPGWMRRPNRLKDDGTYANMEDCLQAWDYLFSFTLGLYTESKLNVEKLEELINSKEQSKE